MGWLGLLAVDFLCFDRPLFALVIIHLLAFRISFIFLSESENYPQAIEDLNACLRRHQEHLPDDSRCIAEVHYQIGVALGFNLEFDKAVDSLQDAINVLEKRVKNLKEKKESDSELDNNLKEIFRGFSVQTSSLKHARSIFRWLSYPVSGSLKSQASSLLGKQHRA